MEKTGHLAWCALIALLTAREDGLVESESQENLFITRWFAQAKKQRRFSRDVATDVDWILNQGERSAFVRDCAISWIISGAAVQVNCQSRTIFFA
jgi:hypothetical protein